MRRIKRGISAYSRNVADAVDNEAWQRLRISLKGLTTEEKIKRLETYVEANVDKEELRLRLVRVDNYLKALARGGLVVLSGSIFSGDLDIAIRR